MKKSVFSTLALALCLGLAPAVSAQPKDVAAVLKAGGGAVGGVGYMTMTALSKVVRTVYPKIDITVVPGGWVGNMFRTNTGEMDIGSTTVAMCALAAAKTTPFDKPLPKVNSLFCTQDKLFYFAIVRKDLQADSLGELFAKKLPIKLCTIQKGTTTELMWRNVFQSQGVSWEDVGKWGGKMNFVAWGDAVNLVKDGHADGILAVGVKKIGWAMELTNERDMKILKWDSALLTGLEQRFGFDRDSIEANTYPKITEAVTCPTDAGAAVVNADVKDEVVEAVLAAVADKDKDYSKMHAALVDFKAQNMAKGLKTPYHPAALKFYKSRNIRVAQ